MSVRLGLDDADELAASLNLYSRAQRERSEERIRQASLFATQLAAAMQSIDAYRSAERLAAGLATAMRSRATIEQAKGIIMAERNVTAEQAFDLLRQASQTENRKLRDVARELVDEHGLR